VPTVTGACPGGPAGPVGTVTMHVSWFGRSVRAAAAEEGLYLAVGTQEERARAGDRGRHVRHAVPSSFLRAPAGGSATAPPRNWLSFGTNMPSRLA
jgi:hypothetical protein